jgi:hypothetical protein
VGRRGGIGIFINTVLEEASQISDYRPPSSRLSNFDMKYNTFATPGRGGGAVNKKVAIDLHPIGQKR